MLYPSEIQKVIQASMQTLVEGSHLLSEVTNRGPEDAYKDLLKQAQTYHDVPPDQLRLQVCAGRS